MYTSQKELDWQLCSLRIHQMLHNANAIQFIESLKSIVRHRVHVHDLN